MLPREEAGAGGATGTGFAFGATDFSPAGAASLIARGGFGAETGAFAFVFFADFLTDFLAGFFAAVFLVAFFADCFAFFTERLLLAARFIAVAFLATRAGEDLLVFLAFFFLDFFLAAVATTNSFNSSKSDVGIYNRRCVTAWLLRASRIPRKPAAFVPDCTLRYRA